MRKRVSLLLAVIAVVTLSTAMSAHHGAATFDTANEITLKGTVTDWTWFNPHCFLKFDVKDASGAAKNWAVEAGNPTDMSKRGWTRIRPVIDIPLLDGRGCWRAWRESGAENSRPSLIRWKGRGGAPVSESGTMRSARPARVPAGATSSTCRWTR